MRSLAALTLATAVAAVPETISYTSGLSVNRGFAGKLVEDAKVRVQLETAAAAHFESTTGIPARVTVAGAQTRRLEEEDGGEELPATAGLTVTYVVTCGSQCTQITEHLNALAQNEACTCALSSGNAYSSTLCNDAAGNACDLIEHVLPEPGGCVSYSGDCSYQQGMAITHAESLIAVVNNVAMAADFEEFVVMSTADEVANSIQVPDSVYIPAFLVPSYQDCVGSFAECDMDSCTMIFYRQMLPSIEYTNQFGFLQAAGTPCAAEPLSVACCSDCPIDGCGVGGCGTATTGAECGVEEAPAPEPAPEPAPVVCEVRHT